jgi:hypothetical protein
MPILNDATMDQRALPTGYYGYSATRLEQLGAAEYTLVTIVNDVSGSVAEFRDEMAEALRQIVIACKLSPRAENLLVRLVTFSDRMREAHGFRLLEACAPDDYRRLLKVGGNTALYDAAENAVAATAAYGKQLTDAGFAANAIVFVITDGMDNASTLGVRELRAALCRAVSDEAVPSLVSILIGVNVADPTVGAYLQDLKAAAGFTEYIEIGQANSRALARLADFVSRSISLQSQSLGGGGTAGPLTF